MNHYGVNCTECSHFSPDPLDHTKYECKAWHLDFNIEDADMGQCSFFERNSKMPFLKSKNNYRNERINERLIDITIAMLKCLESDLSIPNEWIDEWLELYNDKKGNNNEEY